MAVVNHVEKKAKIDSVSIVRFQIMTHCFLSEIILSTSEINCLAFLAIEGEQELNAFCQKANALNLFKSSQTVRNTISKAQKYNLIVKEGRSKKKIYINPDMKIQTKGNIFLDYKFIAVEASKS
jgi:hypothetical protein